MAKIFLLFFIKPCKSNALLNVSFYLGTEKEQLGPADQGVSERTEHVTTSRSLMVSAAEQSLYDYMESILKRRLTCEEAMYYWLQILAAVDYLHNLEVPIIHKDIKGNNAETTIE